MSLAPDRATHPPTQQTQRLARALLVFTCIVLVALFAFAFTGNFVLAFCMWIIVNGFRDLARPITDAWLNQNISSAVRATVL